jgi:hypothetical protein
VVQGWKFKIGLRWRGGGGESGDIERERRMEVKEWGEMAGRWRDGSNRVV